MKDYIPPREKIRPEDLPQGQLIEWDRWWWQEEDRRPRRDEIEEIDIPAI